MDNKSEKAILTGFHAAKSTHDDYDDPYKELERLADTSGAEVVAVLTQPQQQPTPKLFLGSGKIEELHELAQEHEADLIIFNNDLSPLQYRNLERELDLKVIDRTQLILDIFAMRARSSEGKIQVELAQLEYLLPRITGKGIDLSRLGGGIGTRGPGETKLEVDRRRIRDRISMLKSKLEQVERTRDTQNQRRRKRGTRLIALAGYTNAGKSTLFNALSNADTFVEDKLFATLDPLTRRIYIPDVGEALLVDTVGFIRNLPEKLMKTFKSTLEGVREADLIVHVVDISNPQYAGQIAEVETIISDLGASEIPCLMVLNKIDRLEKPERAAALMKTRARAVTLSARHDKDFAALKRAMAEALDGNSVQIKITTEARRRGEKR